MEVFAKRDEGESWNIEEEGQEQEGGDPVKGSGNHREDRKWMKAVEKRRRGFVG